MEKQQQNQDSNNLFALYSPYRAPISSITVLRKPLISRLRPFINGGKQQKEGFRQDGSRQDGFPADGYRKTGFGKTGPGKMVTNRKDGFPEDGLEIGMKRGESEIWQQKRIN